MYDMHNTLHQCLGQRLLKNLMFAEQDGPLTLAPTSLNKIMSLQTKSMITG